MEGKTQVSEEYNSNITASDSSSTDGNSLGLLPGVQNSSLNPSTLEFVMPSTSRAFSQVNLSGIDEEIQTLNSENRSKSLNALSYGLSLSTLNPNAEEFIFSFREKLTHQMNGGKDSHPSFADLPHIPLLKIFSYLDNKDLNRAGFACSRWYNMSKTPNFWWHIPIRSEQHEDLQTYLPIIPKSVLNLRISCIRGKQLDRFSANRLMYYLRKFCPQLDSLQIEHAYITNRRRPYSHPYRTIFDVDPTIPDLFPRSIRELSLEGCCFDLRQLCYTELGNANLEILNLTSCIELDDTYVRYLRSLGNLQELYLSKCDITSMGVISILSNIRNLNVLDLECCFISDFTITSLKRYGTSLRHLYIGHTPVSDEGLMSLSGRECGVLPNLKTLCVRCTDVPRSGVEQSKIRFVSDVDISWGGAYSGRAMYENCIHYENGQKDPLRSCHIEFT